MTDLEALRSEVVAHLRHAEAGRPLDRAAAGGLQMLFNKIAPPHMAIGAARTTLEVSLPSRSRLTTKELSKLTDHFSRAVASIGREIMNPQRGGQLGQADYARAPIFTTHTASGTVLFLAEPDAPGIGGSDNGLTTAEQSLERLVSLMPESADDTTIAARVLSLRPTSARAVSEVAAVAKSTSGLSMRLLGAREPLASVVTTDQAEDITDLLRDSSEESHTFTMKGRLDGMRFKRRMFYLEVGEDREYSGTVDERLMENVQHLLDHEVFATMEKVTRTSHDGRVSRPTYRLVGVAEQTSIDD